MKILTLNAWQERGPWQERWEVIFQGLEDYDPDIVCFQEVFNPDWAEEIKKRAGFPSMVFSPEPSGLMILSHFPVLENKCLTMKTQSPTEAYQRYALFAEIKAGDAPLAVFNTHLSWRLDEGRVREKQAGEFLDFIDDNTGRHEILAAGDFNAPPGTPELEKMRTQGNFQDAYSLLHEDEGCTWNNENPYARQSSVRMPDRRIDYVLFRNSSNLLSHLSSTERVFTEPDKSGVYASDHYGLLAAFE